MVRTSDHQHPQKKEQRYLNRRNSAICETVRRGIGDLRELPDAEVMTASILSFWLVGEVVTARSLSASKAKKDNRVAPAY